eukprot:TRINITY_DN5587_c0_g2_i1.p1 TRINITY_DN5587_c0_g2~~TRINITY_DN5587_c0_g2_i1.p1  ORF type:complete len:347 (+),score=30.80 TRINITY_DN5587_c0_g2_i1:36-1043(+)
MDTLPIELITEVFLWLPVNQIYPRCFVLSKRISSAISEEFWRRQCLVLGVDYCSPTDTWCETFRKNGMQLEWDVNAHTRDLKARTKYSKKNQIVVAGNLWAAVQVKLDQNLFLEGGLARWKGSGCRYLAVRTKRAYTAGRHKFEFDIVNRRSTGPVFAVGVADDTFDPVLFGYDLSKVKEEQAMSYVYWASPPLYEVTRFRPMGSLKSLADAKNSWATGDIVGVLVDMNVYTPPPFGTVHVPPPPADIDPTANNSDQTPDPSTGRMVHFYLNGRYVYSYGLLPSVKRLWPIAAMYSDTDQVAVRSATAFEYPLPSRTDMQIAWDGRNGHWQTLSQ